MRPSIAAMIETISKLAENPRALREAFGRDVVADMARGRLEAAILTLRWLDAHRDPIRAAVGKTALDGGGI